MKLTSNLVYEQWNESAKPFKDFVGCDKTKTISLSKNAIVSNDSSRQGVTFGHPGGTFDRLEAALGSLAAHFAPP